MDSQDFYHQLEAGIPGVLSHLQTVAAAFELPFSAEDYHYLSLEVREKVLLDFLAGCPGLPHSHWGDDDEVRRQQVGDFISSDEFITYCDKLRSGGSVIASVVPGYLEACCRAQHLPDWVPALNQTLKDHPALRKEFFVVISLKEPSEAVLRRMQSLLAHEWSHLLFYSNGIKFQTTAPEHPDAWLFDEGLASWSEYTWQAGQWECRMELEKPFALLKERGEPRSVTGYFEKGLWFNQHFNALPQNQWPQELRTLPNHLPAADLS